MILLAKLGIGVMSAALVSGAALCSEGFIQVKVHEKKPQETNFSVIVPGAIVPLALKFAPNRHLSQASAHLRPYMPALDAAIPVLEDCPDGILVEVREPGEHVVITKSGSSIVVDVNDAGETVHVAVPLRVARNSLHEIAAAGGEY